jgi:short subunit dehydrogenase-like uncharacterized protein
MQGRAASYGAGSAHRVCDHAGMAFNPQSVGLCGAQCTAQLIGHLQGVPSSAVSSAVWTPGALMGLALLRRLQADAGLRFQTED